MMIVNLLFSVVFTRHLNAPDLKRPSELKTHVIIIMPGLEF